jgi:hypothetical protein
MAKKLIVVKQLPVIEEHLKNLSLEIDKKVENALSLVVNEDTVKDVKNLRAELNKDFKEVEDQRKLVKTAIMSPYEAFENIYKGYVGNKYKDADIKLKEKIDEVENQLKAEKEEEVKSYFNECLKDANIDFITYEKTNINVTLSASMKSLKETAKSFIDKVVDDLKLISTQEFNEEILVEYKKDLNVSKAITEVSDRKKALEEEKLRQEELKTKKEEESKVIDKIESVVNTIDIPKVESNDLKDYTVKTVLLEIKVNKEQFNNVTKFLKKEGIVYEWKKN